MAKKIRADRKLRPKTRQIWINDVKLLKCKECGGDRFYSDNKSKEDVIVCDKCGLKTVNK